MLPAIKFGGPLRIGHDGLDSRGQPWLRAGAQDDALPFALTVGNHAKCYGLNKVGMRRRGYSRETLDALHHAFHLLLSAKLNTTQAIELMRAELSGCVEVAELITFIETAKRGVVK